MKLISKSGKLRLSNNASSFRLLRLMSIVIEKKQNSKFFYKS